jgi:N-acetylneuraminic acid mutarotase
MFFLITFWQHFIIWRKEIVSNIGGIMHGKGKKMKTLFTVALVLLVTGLAFGQWVATTPMNTARHGLDAVEHNGNIYVAGGWGGDTTMERYSGGAWTYMASLPVGQAGVCAALVGDIVYTFGDYGWNTTTQKYNINTNSWSAGPAIPVGMYWATAEAIGTNIYLIGGYSMAGDLDTVHILDTNSNTWSTGTSCPVTLMTATSAVLGGYIYVFGQNGDYRYDPANDSWMAISPRIYQTGGASAEVVDGVIYVMGGNYGYIFFAEPYTQIYDPNTNSWSLGPNLIFARYQLTSAYVNDYIYSIGGRDPNGNSQDWVERLYAPTPPPPWELYLWPQTSTIPPGGGTVFFAADVVNNTGAAQTRDAWTMVTTPMGNTVGPLILVSPNFPAGTLSTFQSQNVPGWAPPGAYVFHGYIGAFGPNIIDASDSFTFTKMVVGAGEQDNWEASEWVVASDDTQTLNLPSEYSLENAYPNPFNPTTTLQVHLPQAGDLNVVVFNATGQQVAELANGQFNAGRHALTFDASNLASGLYFVQATVPGHFNTTQKVMLMR